MFLLSLKHITTSYLQSIDYGGFYPHKRVRVICVGSLAAIDCEPRQARKGATVIIDSGAEIRLAQVAIINHILL